MWLHNPKVVRLVVCWGVTVSYRNLLNEMLHQTKIMYVNNVSMNAKLDL